ncbi:MAG: branched-chain amino acid transport system permease protein [Solirubrobacteraceae bacterium]|jgi:branched-chain amino acid transport system permease protein|nr:branched-chain amino acid transport system permease protein [Solirubrobacteraceae bacterium]
MLQQLINALSLGSTYALMAMGLAIIFSTMGVINFAHGELLTLGGYIMWVALGSGVPWPAVLPITIAGTAVLAIVMERVAFRPLRGASMVTLLVTSFALSFFIQTVLGIVLGARAKAVDVPNWTSDVLRVGSVQLPVLQVATTIVTVICLVALAIFLRRSRMGIAMRAASDDLGMVRLLGIRASRVFGLAFALSGMLAGIAALLYVARSGSVQPDTGVAPLIKAFVAVIIGGVGSIGGAVVGGFVLGVLEVLLQANLPSGVRPMSDAFALIVLIAVLMARPSGILGRQGRFV